MKNPYKSEEEVQKEKEEDPYQGEYDQQQEEIWNEFKSDDSELLVGLKNINFKIYLLTGEIEKILKKKKY
jgi:hypothetical protein